MVDEMNVIRYVLRVIPSIEVDPFWFFVLLMAYSPIHFTHSFCVRCAGGDHPVRQDGVQHQGADAGAVAVVPVLRHRHAAVGPAGHVRSDAHAAQAALVRISVPFSILCAVLCCCCVCVILCICIFFPDKSPAPNQLL